MKTMKIFLAISPSFRKFVIFDFVMEGKGRPFFLIKKFISFTNQRRQVLRNRGGFLTKCKLG